MNAIEKIKAKLSAYPDVRYSESPDHIEVHPGDPAGFTVALRITRPGFTVSFEGWHEEFTSEDEALDCFAFGRAWTSDSETGSLLQPFWPSARVEYRQNRVLDPGERLPPGAHPR